MDESSAAIISFHARDCGESGEHAQAITDSPNSTIADLVVSTNAEVPRLAHVRRARMTPIMNLLNLAPDIQEALLFFPSVERGNVTVTERALRKVTSEVNWVRQRKEFEPIVGALAVQI